MKMGPTPPQPSAHRQEPASKLGAYAGGTALRISSREEGTAPSLCSWHCPVHSQRYPCTQECSSLLRGLDGDRGYNGCVTGGGRRGVHTVGKAEMPPGEEYQALQMRIPSPGTPEESVS